MSWDQFYSTVKQKAAYAADKINQTADIAALQVKLSMAERKLNDAYAALGKVAYQHFTSDDNHADAVANAIKPVKLAMANVRALKQEIEAKKAENEGRADQKAHAENAEQEANK